MRCNEGGVPPRSETAVASTSPDDYYKSYIAFLRVYAEAKDAHPEWVAEALYYAAQSVGKWGGLDHGRMGAVLRGRLKRREPYASTSWAQKK